MLLVHSKSTEYYADDWNYDRKLLVTSSPTGVALELRGEEEVIAIGGGSVIDTAKIVSTFPIVAIPTTFSGASRTSHAVYWEAGKKCDIDTEKPITIAKPEYIKSVPADIINISKADCICHAVESLFSKRASRQSIFCASMALDLMRKDDWLNASFLAGDAIEITGTNIIHALSYALTATYEVPHAKALAFLLPRLLPLFPIGDIPAGFCVNLGIDIQYIVEEAFTYPKILDSTIELNRKTLLELLK